MNKPLSLKSKVASLYGWAGNRTQYEDKHREDWGDEVVDEAIRIAHLIEEFEAKMKAQIIELVNTEEFEMLRLKHTESSYHGGCGREKTNGDILKYYTDYLLYS